MVYHYAQGAEPMITPPDPEIPDEWIEQQVTAFYEYLGQKWPAYIRAYEDWRDSHDERLWDVIIDHADGFPEPVNPEHLFKEHIAPDLDAYDSAPWVGIGKAKDLIVVSLIPPGIDDQEVGRFEDETAAYEAARAEASKRGWMIFDWLAIQKKWERL